jgi:hypothetical protein
MKKITLHTLGILLCCFANAQTNHWETAVFENDTWHYVVPTAEPDTNWRKISFNASSWQQGPGGFGFADGDDNTTVAQTVSVFIRITFNIADTSKLSAAILNADYDDGFVAYLNNTEIARANMTSAGKPPYSDLASASHEAVMYTGGNPDYFNINESTLENIVVPGTNVLAIQIHNVTANSSDLSGRFWLSFGIHDVSTFWSTPPSWFLAPVDFTDSNLPIVVINTNNQTIPNEPQIMADMGIIYNGVGIRNNMTDPFNHYNGKIGIEIRGNYSASLPQKPYRFETWDVNGNSIDVPLLGMPAENDWALLATYNDKSFVRNTLANHLFDTMGHYATRSEYVEVVLNGEYQGIYMLSETIKRDNDRVDIAKLNITDITYPQISGGYIIKTDYWDNTNSWQTSYSPIDHPGYQIHLVYDYPAPDVIVPQQQTYIQTFVYDMETALYGPNFTDTANGYRKYISERSFMDYFYVNELARNVDGYKKSCHYYKEKDDSSGTIGKLKAGPVWDFDWAWKDIWDCSIFQATDGSGWSHHINDCSTDNYSPGWMIRFLQDTTFANELNCRWFDLRRNILDTTYMFHYIDSMAAYLNEAQQRHYAYWGHMGAATGTPEIQAPRQTYQQEIDSLKAWIARRIVWMDANMPGTLNGCSFTSINEIDGQNSTPVNAYPNPFTNEINFSIYQDRPEQISVTILNSLGQEVIVPMVIQGSTGTNYVNVPLPENLAEGIYVMRISSGNRVWTQTLIH